MISAVAVTSSTSESEGELSSESEVSSSFSLFGESRMTEFLSSESGLDFESSKSDGGGGGGADVLIRWTEITRVLGVRVEILAVRGENRVACGVGESSFEVFVGFNCSFAGRDSSLFRFVLEKSTYLYV